MNNISIFFKEKYEKIFHHENVLGASHAVLEKLLGPFPREALVVKQRVLFVTTNQLYKNEIVLKKTSLISEINTRLGKEVISDIS